MSDTTETADEPKMVEVSILVPQPLLADYDCGVDAGEADQGEA